MQALIKAIKTLTALVVLFTFFVLGWGANYLTSNLWHASESQCYVEGAVVIACQRVEGEESYTWNIVAIKNEGAISQEVIFIKHVIPKDKFGYFYAF